jgi:hypothetical protein
MDSQQHPGQDGSRLEDIVVVNVRVPMISPWEKKRRRVPDACEDVASWPTT